MMIWAKKKTHIFGKSRASLTIKEREKERERGSNLRRQRLASPTAQVLVAQTTQTRFFWTGWVVWATNTWAVGLARRCHRRFDRRSRSFSLSSTSKFSSLSSTSIFISSRCSFSCHSPLCPAPVRPGCLFRLFLSLLSLSPPNPQSTVSVRT